MVEEFFDRFRPFSSLADVAASDNTRWPLAGNKLLDPRLLLAARSGDSKRLKELMLMMMNDADAEENAQEASAEASKVIIMEVVPQHPPSAVAPLPPALDVRFNVG
jgi:hypothetical protein